ncbi:MAG: GxxExxY protein [Gracilimonas sp.]|nr:GxxExxY protein [Gracilimonas sp.]
MTENEISKIVLDSAIQVHRALGPGLLESAYQKCLAYELEQQGLLVETERGLPLVYKEVAMEVGYRVDIFVNHKVVVEIKSVDALNDIHLAQVLTYLKLSESKLGLLINFNNNLLKNGFRRVVNNL